MARKRPDPAADLRKLIAQAERQGITRYRIAQDSGLSESVVARIAHGETMPRLDTAAKIAEAIGHRVDFPKR